MSLAQTIKGEIGSRFSGEEDVRALLRKDHEEALDLARQICETKGGAARKALFKELKPALIAHSRAEEATVYRPLQALKQDEDARGIANEGFVEHGLLDVLLTTMSSSRTPESETWAANAKVLHELLQHHIEEEHNQMFAELGDNFDSEQLEAMGKRFVAAKARF
jgi:hemerythrin HHE cation binding domain-containing protein